MTFRSLSLLSSFRVGSRVTLSRAWLESVVAGPAGFRLLRMILAAILLFAAAMKTYALSSAGGQAHSYFLFGMPNWVVETTVVAEWVLGTWLFIGKFAYAAWICSIAFFALVLCYALMAGLSGATVCGCFGFLSTSPWLTSLMDSSIVLALIVFRPTNSTPFWSSDAEIQLRGLVIRTGTLFFAISAAVIVFATGLFAQAKINVSRNTLSTREGEAPFLASGKPEDCSAHCVQIAASLARATLGVDPAWPNNAIPTDPKKLLAVLQETASSVGGTIKVLPPDDVIRTLSAGPIAPIVLVSPDDHLYLLLGAIDSDGQLLFQLVHGDAAVTLATRTALVESHFKEAWRFTNGSKDVPIQLGKSGMLLVDGILHNCGNVDGIKMAHTTFRLQNAGDGTITLDKAETSCGCTTTDLLTAPAAARRSVCDRGPTSSEWKDIDERDRISDCARGGNG